MTIKYFLTHGGLPIGAEIKEQGLLHGLIAYDNLFSDNPRWVTPAGTLGVFDEGETPEIPPLVVESPSDYNIVRLSVLRANTHENRQGLPWGLTLDPFTGQISGTIEDLWDPLAQPFVDTEVPVWVTPQGQIANKGELEPLHLQLEAEAVDGKSMSHYFIVRGYLPWGLELSRETGVITGTTYEGIYNGEAEDETTTPKIPPQWQTPKGFLGNRNESDHFELQLQAIPDTGHEVVRYYITNGGLPWGISLDPKTGLLSGEFYTVHNPYEPVYKIPGGPSFKNLKLNGTNVVPDNINIKKGDTIELTFDVEAIEGRTVKHVVATGSSVFPWGLTFDPTNLQITGTVDLLEDIPASFEVKFKAVDNVGAYNFLTMTINVTL